MRAQRRVLLLLILVMASSAALAGGLTASLLRRELGGPAGIAASPTAIRREVACTPVATPDAASMALDAALGRPAIPAAPLDEGAFARLLAPPELPATVERPAIAQPVAAPTTAPATTPTPTPLPPASALPSGYTLDLGYFLVPEQATAFATRVQERGVPVQLLALADPTGRVWTHIRTPPFAGSAQALAGAARIERELGITASLVAPPPPPASPTGAARP